MSPEWPVSSVCPQASFSIMHLFSPGGRSLPCYLSSRAWGRELGGTWFDPQHVCPLEAADKELAEVSIFLWTHCYNDRQWQGGAMAQTQKENEWPQIRSNMPLAQTHRRKKKKTRRQCFAFGLWNEKKMKQKCPKADMCVSSRHLEDLMNMQWH